MIPECLCEHIQHTQPDHQGRWARRSTSSRSAWTALRLGSAAAGYTAQSTPARQCGALLLADCLSMACPRLDPAPDGLDPTAAINSSMGGRV